MPQIQLERFNPVCHLILKGGVSVTDNLDNFDKSNKPNLNLHPDLPQTTAYRWRMRGIRGAISVTENTPEAIYTATAELVRCLFEVNQLDPEDVASIFFSTTRDVDAAFPALAVRRNLGLTDIPLMCSHEMDVPGQLPRVIRVMVHVNTTKAAAEMRHVYLGEAAALRPDKPFNK